MPFFLALLYGVFVPFGKLLTYLEKKRRAKILKEFHSKPVDDNQITKQLFQTGLTPLPPMPLDDIEMKEFEKTKEYLTMEARRLGGDLRWVRLSNGLEIYEEIFFDVHAANDFKKILFSVAQNGMPQEEHVKKEIDSDIENLLKEIENSGNAAT